MIINFDSPYKIDDGYGNAGENILLALDRLPDVQVYTKDNWSHTKEFGLLKRTKELYKRDFSDRADYSIRFSQPDSFDVTPKASKARIGWSMWEFTKLPEAWKEGINSIDINFVPCEHNKQLWLDAGCRKPIYVINLGIDPEYFYCEEDDRENRDIFTFVISGTLSGRKNPLIIYDIFSDLFGKREDVKLIIKSSTGLPLSGRPETDNITIINETWKRTRLADLLRSCDVFVYPTQGEGFGLTPVEAMATGCTTICTDWSGPADYLDEKFAYKLNYNLGGSVGSHWGDIFGYAIPDQDHLKELMWHCYTHQDEAREKGRIAAQWVKNNLTWEHTAKRIRSVLED